MEELCAVLEKVKNSPEKRLDNNTETLVRFHYRRNVRSSTDPFKRYAMRFPFSQLPFYKQLSPFISSDNI